MFYFFHSIIFYFSSAIYLLHEFGDLGDADVDVLDAVPGGVVGDSGGGEAEDALEGADGVLGGFAVDAVDGYCGDGGVAGGYGVQLFLELADFEAAGADGEVVAGPGGGDAFDGFGGVDVEVAAVVVSQDLDGGVALVGEGFAAPLAHPVGTGDAFTVAVLGEDGLFDIGAGQVAAKLFVDEAADVFEVVAAVDPFVVVGGG